MPNARDMMLPRILSASAAAVLALFAATPSTAQETPAPAPAPLATTLPPGASALPPPIVFTMPTPAATPANAPVAVPSVRATPAARTTPVPRATAAPRRTPSPRVATTPRPAPTAIATTAPTPLPVPASMPDTAAPIPGATPSITATPVPLPSPRPERGTTYWPVVGGGLLVLLIAAGVAMRRRRAKDDMTTDDMTIEDAPAPIVPLAEEPAPMAPAPPVAAPPPTAPPPTAPRMLDPAGADDALPSADRAHLSIDVRPLRAGLNLLTATAEVEVLVRNDGAGEAQAVHVEGALFSARRGEDDDLARFFAERGGRPARPPFALPPGASRSVRLLVTMPRSAINVLTAGGREMFVPVVAVNCRYRARADAQGQTARAFAIGVERAGAAKLAPLRLDTPTRMHATVAARAHGIALDS